MHAHIYAHADAYKCTCNGSVTTLFPSFFQGLVICCAGAHLTHRQGLTSTNDGPRYTPRLTESGYPTTFRRFISFSPISSDFLFPSLPYSPTSVPPSPSPTLGSYIRFSFSPPSIQLASGSLVSPFCWRRSRTRPEYASTSRNPPDRID